MKAKTANVRQTMTPHSPERRPRQPKRTTRPAPSSNLAYYVVVLLVGLTGLVSYSSGASLEGMLTRMLVVLLICTVVGYALNLLVWLTRSDTKPAPVTAETESASTGVRVGTRLNVVAGDDEG